MEVLGEIFAAIGHGLLSVWWLWSAVLLGFIFERIWFAWRQFLYIQAIPWAVLEIKIPREIKKSPKGMEQILASLTNLRNAAANLREWYWDGEVVRWFSFELVSFGGEIHFYVRTPTPHMNIVKSNFYGQYPEIEIEEIDDYIERFPANTYELYERGYDVFATEMVLGRGNGLPIRTYLQFEDIDEERNVDTIAGLLEILSKIAPQEVVAVQILARPADPRPTKGWVVAVQKEAAAFKEKTKSTVTGPTGEEYEIFVRTPGETETMKQIEAKAFKPAFECMIRYLYLGPRNAFNVNLPYRGLRSCFQQLGAPNINFFDANRRTWTRAWMWDWPHIFPGRIREGRKNRIIYNYRERLFPPDTFMGKLAQFSLWTSGFKSRPFVLNVEELATIFHLPTAVVLTQPIIKRVESRKLGPPAGLPIFKEKEAGPDILK